MRRFAFATMLICLHTMGLAAEPEDTPATRRQAAERYAEANDLPKMLADVMPMVEAEMKHAVEASRADKAKTPGT